MLFLGVEPVFLDEEHVFHVQEQDFPFEQDTFFFAADKIYIWLLVKICVYIVILLSHYVTAPLS